LYVFRFLLLFWISRSVLLLGFLELYLYTKSFVSISSLSANLSSGSGSDTLVFLNIYIVWRDEEQQYIQLLKNHTISSKYNPNSRTAGGLVTDQSQWEIRPFPAPVVVSCLNVENPTQQQSQYR